jgi:Peptidase M30
MIRSTSGRKAKLQALSALCLTAFLAACGGGGGGGDVATTNVNLGGVSPGSGVPGATAILNATPTVVVSNTPTVTLSKPSQISLTCSSTSCSSAVGTASIGNAGAMVWNYSNTSTTATSVDIALTSVVSGKVVSVIFSNGSTIAASSVPSLGASPDLLQNPLAAPQFKLSMAAESLMHDHHDTHHHQTLDNNRQIAKSLVSDISLPALSTVGFDALIPPTQALYAAPALNTAKTWIDYGGSGTTPKNYPTTAQATCTVPNGRNVVVWVDPAAQSLGKVSASSIASVANSYCGGSGGYRQVTSLLGDAWGFGAGKYATLLIQDTPTVLQDINIVILNVPSTAGWAGYFYGGNNFLKTATQPNTNQALVFFINADTLNSNLNFALSTLLHETTHMVNFYQRAVNIGYQHDTWLEETSAMMTEDIVTPTVVKDIYGVGYNKIISSRLPGYLLTGGGVSYVNWPNLSGPNYSMGGAFGAFLNRRYGLSIYQQLVSRCIDGTATTTSYGCLDSLIKTNGGVGYSDEFARFGATIFGAMPAVGAPTGYGYPALTSTTLAGTYNLMPIDVSALSASIPTLASPLASGFTATTHTYLRDTIAVGATSYSRRGIVVPPNTSVTVVVK